MARPRQSAATRLKLLDQGVAALIDGGYHGVGLKEILDRVHVPKGSFYNYFESKEHFGAEVIRHYAARQHEEADAHFSNAGADALGLLRDYFNQAIDSYRSCDNRAGCLIGNLAAELGDSSEPCRVAMAHAMQGLQDRFEGILELAQRQGSVRDDMPADRLAAFVLNAWEGALLRMKIEKSFEPLHQFVAMVLEDFLLA